MKLLEDITLDGFHIVLSTDNFQGLNITECRIEKDKYWFVKNFHPRELQRYRLPEELIGIALFEMLKYKEENKNAPK